MKYNKNILINNLKEMNLKKDDTIFIHSSLKSINYDADVILDSLFEYFNEGLILLPTHTWKQMNENYNYFNPLEEESCVGLLTNIFRKRKNVIRSLHPTHSMAGYGKDAKEYLKNEENFNTPTPFKGCYGRLIERNTKILLMGVGLRRCTFIHSIEEKYDVKNRFTKNPILFKIQKDNEIIERYFYKHYNDKYPHLSEHFDKLEPILIKKNIIEYYNFGDSKTMLINSIDLYNFVSNLLERDKEVFSDPGELIWKE